MKIEQTDADLVQVAADWLILPVHDAPSEVDGWLGGAVGRRREGGDFTGAIAETLKLFEADGAGRVVLAGCGPEASVDRAAIRRCCRAAMLAISHRPLASVAVVVPERDAAIWSEEAAAAAEIAGSSQALYKAEPKRYPIGRLILVGRGDAAAAARGQALGQSMGVVRDLVNRPASDVYPETFADRARQLANEVGLECDVLGPDWLLQEKFLSMLAVAQGSDRPARLVVLKHRGGGDESPWTGLCGKGVTFDSGGYSLKPSESMKYMKCDMAGGATVLGAMLAIAKLDVPANVIGVIGLVENMISGNAYKLGDVLRSRSGRTIEVHNTDAEGRLVLADVLNWTADQGVARIVDLATLTGACVVGLGEEYVGLFPGDEALGSSIRMAARETGELVWPMPMDDHFAQLLDSEIADCKNVGPRWGGAITAAKFLQPFAGPTPWAHLDIAGPAFAETGTPERDSGATGVMVPTLVRLVESVA